MDLFKTQLLTWGMITSDYTKVFCSFLFIEGLTFLEKYLQKEKKPVKASIKNVVNTDEPKTASIEFQYYTNFEDVLIESILEHICKQDSAVFLRYSNTYKPSNKKKFYVTDNILCQILNVDYGVDGKLTSFQFEIYSNTLKLRDLHKWIDGIRSSYEIEKKNQLGERKYFFKEMACPPMMDNRGNYVWNTAHRELKFTMTPFSTNKHLSNIFGDSIDEIKQRVDLFTEHPEWYEQRGIPHTLGLLLRGPPGTGKSSCIKAIAKDTGKHIIQVSLADYTTQDQLNNLFFTENIEVVADGRSHFYKIPLNERLYVFEDIDCLTALVSRESNDYDVNNVVTMDEMQGGAMNVLKSMDSTGPMQNPFPLGPPVPMQTQIKKKDDNGKAINLNYLLNLLDGILETPERLLIMTSNYPEKLDKALIRPGRIDLNVEFGNLSSEEVKRMFDFYYSIPNSEYLFGMEFDRVLTPATISQVLGTNYRDSDKAYTSLKQLLPEYVDDDLLDQIPDFQLPPPAEVGPRTSSFNTL